MTTTSLKIRITLALSLLAGGVYLHQNPQAMDAVTAAVSSPLEWLGVVDSTPAKWYIVEETGDRSNLPQSEIIVLATASQFGVTVIDKDIVGPDKKTPAELSPVIAAATAKGKTLPQLVKVTQSGRRYCYACPLTQADLKKAIGAK